MEMIQKEKDFSGLVAHGKSVKKPDVAHGLSEEGENMQDTSKVSAGTMCNFRLLSSRKVK